MGSVDNPPTQTKTNKPDKFDKAGEPASDTPNVTAIRDKILHQLQTGGHDNTSTPASTAAQRGQELGAHLDVLGRELNALGQLGDRRSGLFRDGTGKVHDVHAVIEDADNHFQTLAIAAQNEAKGSAGVMWQTMQNQEHYIDKRLPELQQTLKSEISPEDQQKLGINFDKPLTPDQIQNAIIKRGLDNGPNVQNDPVSRHLTEYLTLNEMNNIYSQVKTAADVANKAPAMVNLAYAAFLMEYKDGISVKQGEDGKPYAVTAAHVVDQIAAADKQALPGSQQTQEQAEKMTVDLMRSHGIPDDKNPLIPLLEGQKKNDIGLLQKAADLSKDDKFDPDKTAPEFTANQKAIADLQASVKDRQPTDDEQKKMQGLVADNAVLQARMLVRSDAYKALGEAELKQKDGDVNKALGDLRTSIQSDPRNTPDKNSVNYKPETDPNLKWENYQKQARAVVDGKLLGDHPELKDVVKLSEENPDFQKNLQGALGDMQKFNEFLKAHPPGQKPPTEDEMSDAKKTLDSWYGQSDSLQKMLGNAGPAIDKAYQDLTAKKDRTPQENEELQRLQPLYAATHQKTLAAMEQGRFDARTGHIDDAKAKMEEAGKDTTLMQSPDVKAQLDAYNGIVKQAQFDNSPWYARWGKYIGAGVAAAAVPVLAWGAGIALAPETLGGSLVAAAAVTGVGLGAGAIGTAAGVGLERAGGARDSTWDAVKDVAPWAMTTGGLVAGFYGIAAPALATGEAAAGATGATGAAATDLAGQTGVTAAKAATGWARIPGVGQLNDFMATKTIFTPANQVNWFANMAKGTSALPEAFGAARPLMTWTAGAGLRNGMMLIPGAVGVAATSDHPVIDSLSMIGTGMAAAPLGLLGKTTGAILPRGLQTIGGFALPVGTAVGADFLKNVPLALADSRGGDATWLSKAWMPTFIDATKAMPAGIFVPGIPGILSAENRDEAMRAAAIQAAQEKAAREQPDDDDKKDK